jgi:hypothetical protein
MSEAKSTRKRQSGRVAKHLLTKDGLTPKQSKFVDGIAKGLPAYKAAMQAYNVTSLNTANNMAVENQQKPTVREAIAKALEFHALTAVEATQPVADALRAEDIETRLKGSDRYFKLLQMTDTDRDKGNGGQTINFNFNSDTYVNTDKPAEPSSGVDIS